MAWDLLSNEGLGRQERLEQSTFVDATAGGRGKVGGGHVALDLLFSSAASSAYWPSAYWPIATRCPSLPVP